MPRLLGPRNRQRLPNHIPRPGRHVGGQRQPTRSRTHPSLKLIAWQEQSLQSGKGSRRRGRPLKQKKGGKRRSRTCHFHDRGGAGEELGWIMDIMLCPPPGDPTGRPGQGTADYGQTCTLRAVAACVWCVWTRCEGLIPHAALGGASVRPVREVMHGAGAPADVTRVSSVPSRRTISASAGPLYAIDVVVRTGSTAGVVAAVFR